MLVIVEFTDDFENIVKGTKVSLDPEYNDSIENVKVLITLKYSELELKNLNLYYNGRRLKNHEHLQNLGIKESAVIQVRKGNTGCCNTF